MTLFPWLSIGDFVDQLEMCRDPKQLGRWYLAVKSIADTKPATSSPATDPGPVLNPLDTSSVIIDVANVCGTLSPDPSKAFALLLTILLELHREGLRYLSLTESKMMGFWKQRGLDADAARLQKLFERHPHFFGHIQTGEADQFILAKADKSNCRILSNDQFQDYREQYPWLQLPKSGPDGKKALKGNERVLVCSTVQGRVEVPSLGISATVVPEYRSRACHAGQSAQQQMNC